MSRTKEVGRYSEEVSDFSTEGSGQVSVKAVPQLAAQCPSMTVSSVTTSHSLQGRAQVREAVHSCMLQVTLSVNRLTCGTELQGKPVEQSAQSTGAPEKFGGPDTVTQVLWCTCGLCRLLRWFALQFGITRQSID